MASGSIATFLLGPEPPPRAAAGSGLACAGVPRPLSPLSAESLAFDYFRICTSFFRARYFCMEFSSVVRKIKDRPHGKRSPRRC